MAQRIFGHVPGWLVGSTFQNRTDLSKAGVHRPTQHGISGSASEGADSIVVSGGYEDDEDLGSVIVYTGHGGRDPGTGRQVADQRLERQNLALAKSCLDGLPVRVVRGAHGSSPLAPPAGYRYDGLFHVDEFWFALGRSGHLVVRFRLISGEPDTPIDPSAAAVSSGVASSPAPRVTITGDRIIRNGAEARRVKGLHHHRCQICGEQIETWGGPYAEGAHIRPLGIPHNGPDVLDNLLCLCPNDHVRLDHGALYINEAIQVVETGTGTVLGPLRTAPGHLLAPEHLAYHRGLWAAPLDVPPAGKKVEW